MSDQWVPRPAPTQADPSLLPEGDFWTWGCGRCGATVQGGRAGLDAHVRTVHPDRMGQP